jgi:hypothetical protein
MTTARKLIGIAALGGVLALFMVTPGDAADPALNAVSNARNVFINGFTTSDKVMPSTASGNDPAASIAKLKVGKGNHVIFASVVFSVSNTTFSGIITCHLVPPNGPNSKTEWQPGVALTGPTTQTMFVQTTNKGAGTVDFRCSDTDLTPAGSPGYRFLQLTAIEVPKLKRTDLFP